MDKLTVILKEDDENECTETEGNYYSHSYSEDDFYFGPNYIARQDRSLKILVNNIIETYNTYNPNYKYQMIKGMKGK